MRTGIQVLDHGLPPLPAVLTYDMTIPVAYWKAGQCAIVLMLTFDPRDHGSADPSELQLIYSRGPDGSWTPPSHAFGSNFGYNPIANPDGRFYGLDGQVMVTSGGSQGRTLTPGFPACTAVALISPEVQYLALTKDGQEDRRPVESHFGAWVVCIEDHGPYELATLDANGAALQSMQLPQTSQRPAEIQGSAH